MLILFLTLLLLILYCILILFYRSSWNEIPEDIVSGSHNTFSTFITVIVPARNEEMNIKACIDSILSQEYSANLYEIIVVDDHSTDNTAKIISTYPPNRVRLINLANELNNIKLNSYKKKSIEIAISKASGTLIVTTDADCIVQPKWLQCIAASYEKSHPYFIAAPVAFYEENSVLKIFQSLDFLTMQGITGAAVFKKFQCMCNGANLAYEKKVFNEVGGFKGIDNIASGDDMLLMYKIFSSYPEKVLFLKNKNAIVKTKAADTISSFINQRIRWAGKAGKFKDKKITLVLILVYLFNASLFFMTMYSILYPFFLVYCLSFWIIKTFIELIFITSVATFFDKKKLLWWFAPLQPLHVFYILISGWLGVFGSYTWKDRKVK